MQIKDYLKEHEEEFKPWLVDNEQGRIDIKILPYLQDIENGSFIEAGALEGLTQSNTKVLEELGWKGLLIEPSEKAAINCSKNRTNPVVQCALVALDFEGEYITGDFIFDGEFGVGAYSSVHRKAYGIMAPKGNGENFFHTYSIPVPARTLASILKEHKIKYVDFLSLDVEGFEMEVLRGINFDETYIKYMLIEVNLREYTLRELEHYLEPFGYAKGINISGFTKENTKNWPGNHQDYLFICK